MDAKERRQEIRRIIDGGTQPISASLLAKQLNVSRQIIVGDVALLRAEGFDILSTARGYMDAAAMGSGRYVAKLACCHGKDQTVDELYTIVDMGGHVLDVVVEHPLYGEIVGRLDLTCRRDVDLFIEQVASGAASLLSALTGGVHLHTVSCPDEATFLEVKKALESRGFLYPEK